MTLPNFVIVGAARSGTTALATFLGRHPDVFVARRKEMSHFLFRDGPPTFTGPGDDYLTSMVVTDRYEYEAMFDGAAAVAAVGEASVYYLHNPAVFPTIDEALPGVKAIAILREPTARAFSAFALNLREGRETVTDLRRAVALEDDRRRAGWEWNWEYVGASHYADRVAQLLEVFGPDRVLLLRHDELEAQPTEVLARTFSFLGVDPTVRVATHERINPSGRPRSRRLHRFLRQPHPVKDALRPVVPDAAVQRTYRYLLRRNLTPLELSDDDRRFLEPMFRDDLRHLEALTGWDLSSWRSTNGAPRDTPVS